MTPDYGSEVMAETLAQCALVKPVYTIPIMPASSNSQYRHPDHLDLKDYKKVRLLVTGCDAVEGELEVKLSLRFSSATVQTCTRVLAQDRGTLNKAVAHSP